MGFKDTYFAPIDIETSKQDSRNLIMPHQSEAVAAMSDYFCLDEDKENRAGVVVMPTGSGKTYTSVTWLLNEGITRGYRIVWLVHRTELVSQTYNEFVNQSPQLKGSGVKKLRILPISSMHTHMSTASRADIYVASIASVASRNGYRFIERMLGAAGKRKVIVVIDEAHHSVTRQYTKVLNRIRILNPNMVLLGITATPFRMSETEQGKLQRIYHVEENIKNKKGINGYVYEVTLSQLIASKYLAKPIFETVKTNIVGDIEYHLSKEDEAFFDRCQELSERIKNQIARSSVRNKIILQKYLDNRDKYGKTLVFAVNQEHARTLCEDFRLAGVSCDYAISGRRDSQEVINKFKDTKSPDTFDVLINVYMLTEGSDVPSIQTVFLTAETNSVSRLSQMVGRGLRGPEAGGTEKAYIVSFHDMWERFGEMLDPSNPEILDIPPDDYIEIEEELPDIVSAPLEGDVDISDNPEKAAIDIDQNGVSYQELYLKLYESVKANVIKEDESKVYPVGWYSFTNHFDESIRLFVYDTQEKAYKNIERNIPLICDAGDYILPELIINQYFFDTLITPSEFEIDSLLDFVIENMKMPPYYSLEGIDNPKVIAKKVKSLFEKEEEQEEWLFNLFNHSEVLKSIYKYFIAFKSTVFNVMKDFEGAVINKDDDREEYIIVDEMYDLNELLQEVCEMFPKLSTKGLTKVAWSNVVVKDWFGQCTFWDIKNDEGVVALGERTYAIQINKVLSSPEIEKEVIKYLVFHELLHLNGYGWNSNATHHDLTFSALEWQYPDSARLDNILDTLSVKFNMESIFLNAPKTEILDNPLLENPEQKKDIRNSKADTIVKTPIFNPAASGIKEGFIYCMNCGFQLPETAKFCKKCGTKVE